MYRSVKPEEILTGEDEYFSYTPRAEFVDEGLDSNNHYGHWIKIANYCADWIGKKRDSYVSRGDWIRRKEDVIFPVVVNAIAPRQKNDTTLLGAFALALAVILRK